MKEQNTNDWRRVAPHNLGDADGRDHGVHGQRYLAMAERIVGFQKDGTRPMAKAPIATAPIAVLSAKLVLAIP
jgi:hypothetical protein